MFHLRPVGTDNDDFVYRTYPKDWTIARKPKIGPPKARTPPSRFRTRTGSLRRTQPGLPQAQPPKIANV